MDTPQFIEHISHNTPFTPFSVNWVPCSAKLAVVGCHARGSGVIQLLEMTGSTLKLLSSTDRPTGIKCSTFAASSYEQRQLATGDYSGQLQTWDVSDLTRPVFSVQAHSSIINSIDGCGGLNIGAGAAELVTGSRDGNVRVWDVRQSEPVAALEPEGGAAGRDCWAVAFGHAYNDTERTVAAGYDNGDVKLLCLRTNRLLWETNVNNGVVALQFDRKDIQMNKLVVTSLESKYRVYDMRTLHPTSGYAGSTLTAHSSTVWSVRHVPSNRDVWLTTGGNGSMQLSKYEYPAQRTRKVEGGEEGVMGEVTVVAKGKWGDQPIVSTEWHAEKVGLLATASLDQQVRVGIVTKLNNL